MRDVSSGASSRAVGLVNQPGFARVAIRFVLTTLGSLYFAWLVLALFGCGELEEGKVPHCLASGPKKVRACSRIFVQRHVSGQGSV